MTPWSTIGYLVAKRTYARRLNPEDVDSPTEEWEDIVERVLRGADEQLGVGFTEEEEQRLREHLLMLRGSVAGRFLWQLGTDTVDRLGLSSLQNCACVAVDSPVRPFTWTMDSLMLGCGVGFNIQREYVYKLPKVSSQFVPPKRLDSADADFIVPDTREGWVKLLEYTLRAAFPSGILDRSSFTYSTQLVRSAGAPIKGFGGTASGPEILCEGIKNIAQVLEERKGKQLRPIDCLDIMNIIGAIVVAGNVRRSAQIALGDMDDFQYLRSKRWDLGNIPNWRSNSNNSVICNDFNLLPDEIWKGYTGSGEAFGLINLKLARSVGRTGERQYPDKEVIGFNPCAEQSLANFETCVTGDTKIQTREGIFSIKDLVGESVEVYNGESWSKVVPFMAKEEDAFTRVHFSDGSYLDANEDHEWSVNNREHKKVKTAQLKVGDRLPKFELPTDGGSYVHNAYTLGAFCGDGFVDRLSGKPCAFLCAAESGKHIFEHVDLVGEVYKPRYREGCQPMYRARVAVDGRVAEILRDKSEGLPQFIMNMDKQSVLEFLAGYIDTDGNAEYTGSCENFRIFGTSEQKMRDLQLLCRRAGINYAQLGVQGKKGDKTNFGERNYNLYRLTIPSFECGEIPTKIKKITELGSRYKKNPAHERSRLIDTAPRQRIVRIEKGVSTGPSYCFSEPLRHMGVFGNVLTYQCCLSELFLPNIRTYEELEDVATLLYRVCKHSLNLPCHNKETEEIVHRNQRMGIGVTGYLQATEEQRQWLPKLYTKLREYDVSYSEQRGWPKSIKLTTTKPSGTLSLLPGVTPGCHPAYAQYMVRRIRLSADSKLVPIIRDAGYKVEPVRGFDGRDDRTTVVAEFPFAFPEGTRLAKDMSAIDQLEVVKRLQEEWSDNAVSCTVYYRKEELPAIKEYLSKYYNKHFKSLSFLLHSDHGFDQAPLEEITKEQYEKLVKNTKLLRSASAVEEFESGEDCVGGVCPIR